MIYEYGEYTIYMSAQFALKSFNNNDNNDTYVFVMYTIVYAIVYADFIAMIHGMGLN